MSAPVETTGPVKAAVQWVLGALAVALGIVVITIPLDLNAQWLFAAGVILLAALAFRTPGRKPAIIMCVLALLASTRYIFWRTTQTLEFESFPEFFLGGGLYLAELYAWLILVLGLVQTAWPLRRPVVPLTGDDDDLPTVDVFIPTYNESLSIVSTTVFAAMAMDYPAHKFRVYLLDDGRRPEFRKFAQLAGCGYLTRPDNLHAKAGNLNAALTRTQGELICIFDCDHVATRAFLQMTVGQFQRDARLGIVQTPHHFYSPDPVQRNVARGADMPGEGDLFYGSVQSGNDLWNATFFCGSCAVIRREALAQVGGFAGETVTEDAHTALKIQRNGWNTAYVNARVSAGLATERLSLHIGQRARWARGMTQILRRDNPLFGPGLSLAQRACYLNAMLHFQFPLARIVFLTSPLAYLIAGQNIIYASAAMIFAYAVPHLVGSTLTSKRLQGDERRLFWGEIYETILAFHLVVPTLATLFNPKAGKFNVTDKGGLLEQGFFDARTVRPHLIVMALLVIGIVFGFVKLAFPLYFNIELSTLLLNTAWSVYNILILYSAVQVARETRQVREDVRFPAQLPVSLYLENGHVVDAVTENVSLGGLSIVLPEGVDLNGQTIADVALPLGGTQVALPVSTVSLSGGKARVRFGTLAVEDQRRLVIALMGRADAWEAQRTSTTPAQKSGSKMLPKTQPKSARAARLSRGAAATLAFAAVGMLAWTAPFSSVMAQSAASAATAATPSARVAAPVVAATAGVRQVRLSLEDMRVPSRIRLAGVQGEIGVPFGLRQDEVVSAASLTLNFAHSPALIEELSSLVVLINGEVVRSVPLRRQTADGIALTFPVNPALLVPGDNRLNLRFIGHYTRDCEDPLNSVLWANISNTRTFLDLSLRRLPPRADLADFPAPFFDRFDGARLTLPFVFAGPPTDRELEAAASLASRFGALASYRGFAFPVSFGQIPAGNAIVFALPNRTIPGIAPTISGPGVTVIPNPADRGSVLLVVSGRNEEELKLAAAALASGSATLAGTNTDLSGSVVGAMARYSAPRWLRTDRPVQLGELVDPLSLVGQGLPPGALTAAFRLAPDLFFWPGSGARLDVGYNYPKAAWLDRYRSRLDVSLNGQYVRTLPLAATGWVDQALNTKGTTSVQSRGTATLPAYALFGQNELSFYYDLQLADKGRCRGQLPTDVKASIDPTTKIDLTGSHHAARMPNLAFLSGAGFPFTRTPDLGETAVLLAPTPSRSDLEAFLALMGRFGDSTGAAATRVEVLRQVDGDRMADKDILVIGPASLAASTELFEGAPVAWVGNRMEVAQGNGLTRFLNLLSPEPKDGIADVERVVTASNAFEGLVSFRSPFGRDHSVVAVLSSRPDSLPGLVDSLALRTVNEQVQGDLAMRTAEGFSSFRVGPTYWTGAMPGWLHVAYWFSQRPLVMILAALLAALLVATPIFLLLQAQERRRLAALTE